MRPALAFVAILSATSAMAADELSLPDSLTTVAGERIKSPEQWRNIRRPETLGLFRKHVYGRTPIGRPDDLRFDIKETTKTAMSGAATRKLVDIHFSGPGGKGVIHLAVFIPNNVSGPAPGFLLICHRKPNNIDPTRQEKSPFWPAERIVERGYAASAIHISDIDRDNYKEEFTDGVHPIFDPKGVPRPDDAWGTLAAWAWGASRVMDYFETDGDVDATRIAVVGHSRGGKAALWCGAEDERFALAISNDSGCTGAALARRRRGETIKDINRSAPHWTCRNYKKYSGKEETLPVDQHQLIALMAPRLVYVASATQDGWADPEGEFLSCVHAGPVYRLFGLSGVGSAHMPKPDQPLHDGHIGYHLRTGKHDLTEYDWNCFMDFADMHWKGLRIGEHDK